MWLVVKFKPPPWLSSWLTLSSHWTAPPSALPRSAPPPDSSTKTPQRTTLHSDFPRYTPQTLFPRVSMSQEHPHGIPRRLIKSLRILVPSLFFSSYVQFICKSWSFHLQNLSPGWMPLSIPPPLTAAGRSLHWAWGKPLPAPACPPLTPHPSPPSPSSSHSGLSSTLIRPTLTKTFHVFQLTCNSSPHLSLQGLARPLVTWPWTLFEFHVLPVSPLGSSHTSSSFALRPCTCCSLWVKCSCFSSTWRST